MSRKIKLMVKKVAFFMLLAFVGLTIAGCKIFPPFIEPKYLIPPLIDPTDLVPDPHHGFSHDHHHDPGEPGPPPRHRKHKKHHKEPEW